MQVEDDRRPGRAGRAERPEAEGRVDVVGVDDPCTGPVHRGGDLAGVVAAAQQPERSAARRHRRRVALQQLGRLPQPLRGQPAQRHDRPFLAALRPVAVVQVEDHAVAGSGSASVRR